MCDKFGWLVVVVTTGGQRCLEFDKEKGRTPQNSSVLCGGEFQQINGNSSTCLDEQMEK